MMLGTRNARRQVREDDVIPAKMSDEPVGRRERDPLVSFFLRDAVAHARCRAHRLSA